MIVQETYSLNGRQMVRTYSDAGRYIIGGNPDGQYGEANDPAELGRTYVEGELMPIDGTPEEAALVRFSNELTGQQDETLVEATETLIKKVMEV